MKISFPTWSMVVAGASPSMERKASIVDLVIEGSLSNPFVLSSAPVPTEEDAKDDDKCSACSWSS